MVPVNKNIAVIPGSRKKRPPVASKEDAITTMLMDAKREKNSNFIPVILSFSVGRLPVRSTEYP